MEKLARLSYNASALLGGLIFRSSNFRKEIAQCTPPHQRDSNALFYVFVRSELSSWWVSRLLDLLHFRAPSAWNFEKHINMEKPQGRALLSAEIQVTGLRLRLVSNNRLCTCPLREHIPKMGLLETPVKLRQLFCYCVIRSGFTKKTHCAQRSPWYGTHDHIRWLNQDMPELPAHLRGLPYLPLTHMP